MWDLATAGSYAAGAEIKPNQKIAIRAWNGWVKAENAGGSVLRVYNDTPTPGTWGTFTLVPAKY